jgi:hypothetical protein
VRGEVTSTLEGRRRPTSYKRHQDERTKPMKSSLAPSSTGMGEVVAAVAAAAEWEEEECERGRGRVLIYKEDGVNLDHRF